MPETNKENLVLTYDSQGNLSQSAIEWLQTEFFQGVNLYRCYTDRLNYNLAPRNQDTEYEEARKKFTTVNKNIALISLSEEVIKSRITNTVRNQYGRTTPWWQMSAEDTSTKPFVYPLEINTIKKIKVKNEEDEEVTIKIHSQWSESTLRYFGQAIDLTDVNLNLTLDLIKEIKARESEYARTRRFVNYTTSNLKIDGVASFSCLGSKLSKEIFLQKAGTSAVKTIRIDSLYRGGNGSANITLANSRPTKIAKGGIVFPYLIKLPVINQKTFKIEYKIFFCLGIFDALSKIIKYKRSRAFIPALVKDIERMDGLKLFNPQKYKKIMKKKYGQHTTYWNGISDIWSDMPDSADVKEETFLQKVTGKDLQFLQKADAIAASQEKNKFSKIEKAYTDLKTKIDNLDIAKKENERALKWKTEDLENTKNRLAEIQTSLEKLNQKNSIIINEQSGYKPAFKSLEKEFLSEEQTYKNYVKNFIENLTETDKYDSVFLKNTEKTGIIIDDIKYMVGEATISIKDKPDLALSASYKSNSIENSPTLQSLAFHITKPVVIRVNPGNYDDPEKAKKIVGGPYGVLVTKNSLSIWLTTSKSCFGFQNENNAAGNGGYLNCWVHPHTPTISVDCRNWSTFTNTLVGKKVNGCLGEASAAIYNAFESGDPKRVLFAAMTWITCANSADAWGKHWKYFPLLKDVNLDGRINEDANEEESVEVMMTTEEGMDRLAEIAADLLENLSEAPATAPAIEPEPIHEEAIPTTNGIAAIAQEMHDTATRIAEEQLLQAQAPPDPATLRDAEERANATYRMMLEQAERLRQTHTQRDEYLQEWAENDEEYEEDCDCNACEAIRLQRGIPRLRPVQTYNAGRTDYTPWRPNGIINQNETVIIEEAPVYDPENEVFLTQESSEVELTALPEHPNQIVEEVFEIMNLITNQEETLITMDTQNNSDLTQPADLPLLTFEDPFESPEATGLPNENIEHLEGPDNIFIEQYLNTQVDENLTVGDYFNPTVTI